LAIFVSVTETPERPFGTLICSDISAIDLFGDIKRYLPCQSIKE